MEYIVTQIVDYLSFTTNTDREFYGDKHYEFIKSPNGNYDMCSKSDSGALHLWNTRDARVGHHYIYSGGSLEYMRLTGANEIEMVKWALERSNIKRIDLALTSRTKDESAKHGFTPHHVAWAVRDEMLVSRMKPSKDITEKMKTQTKYIGNRKTRRRLFRAYDKGVDNGQLANILIRYELETRGGTKTIARAVVAGDKYAAIIRRYVDFPNVPAWLDITNTEPTHMQHAETTLSAHEQAREKSLSRWNWLQDSIPKTVQKALLEDYNRFGIEPRDNEQFVEFIHKVMAQLDITRN